MLKLRKTLMLPLCLLMLFFIGGCASSNAKILERFFDQLNISTMVESNLNLASSYEFEGKTIEVVWESNNERALNNQGVITRLETDQTIILIGTASLNGETLKKRYIITILGDTSMKTLQKVADSLILPQTIDASLSLTTSKEADGKVVNIVWFSSHPDIIDATGKLTLPASDTVVTLTAHLSLGTSFLEKSFSITVLQDPNLSPSATWHQASVYQDQIVGEIAPGRQSEFPGAVYRKCVSSRDYWLGIEVVVTLPEFIPDEKRKDDNPYAANTYRYLDNPSVYLGGNSSAECDTGLSWSFGAQDANCTAVDYSQSVAFRPFWRYIDGGRNNYANSNWKDTCYYYYPGDTVRISVFSPRPNFLQLRVELLKETTIEKYVQKRASYNLGSNYSKVFLSEEFAAKGMGTAKAEFKRVCALDQVNNEGKPTQKTNAASLNCIWQEVYLYRNINGTIYKVPMVATRFSACNAPSSFTNCHSVTYEGVNVNLGGEVVSLSPNNNN